MKLTFNLDDGDEIVELIAYLRPPSSQELDAYQRMVMIILEGQSNNKDLSIFENAQFGSQMKEELKDLAIKMLYDAKGDIPKWAVDCESPKDVIINYCIGELCGAARESLEDSVSKALPKKAIEAEIEKN